MSKAVKLIGILILVVAAVGIFWGWDFSSSLLTTEKCDLPPAPREFRHTSYYNGPLFDAHLHVPVSSWIVSTVGNQIGFKGMTSFSGELTPQYLTCLLASEDIKNAFGFFLTTKFSLGKEIRAARRFSNITPFFMPGPYDALLVSIASVKESLDKNEGLFKGIGEVKSFDNSSLEAPKFIELYDAAQERGLIVMAHPYQQHREAVEKILKKYPDVNFLFHGGNADSWIMAIIRNYPNAYYSLDANLFNLYGWQYPKHEQNQPNKEEWLAYIRENFDSVLNGSLSRWKGNIESYPGRFLWGSDRWYRWHFDQEVSALINEFSRAFIGRLAPSVQERFAYKNAEKLLEK